MKKLLIVCTLFVGLFGQKSIAQEFNENDKSYLKIATRYYSDVVYSGRRDSVRVPYIEPSLSYFHESGFFVSAALAFNPISKLKEPFDRFTFETGYEFPIAKNLDAGVYYANYKYNANSEAISSDLQSDIGFDINYTKNHWLLSGGGYLFFSGLTDKFSYLSLAYSQEIKIGNRGMKLFILPKISSNQGTQKFVNNRTVRRLRQTTTTAVTSNNFNVLNYEAGLELNLAHPKWGITLESFYAIPVNPALIASNRRTGDRYEKLSNVFYTQFSVYLKLGKTKSK